MLAFLTHLFSVGPGWTICIVATGIWGFSIIVVAISTLGRRFLAGITHAVLIDLVDSHFEIGGTDRRPLEALHIAKLRSINTGAIGPPSIRVAQEITHGRSRGSYAKQCIARALGQWVEREYDSVTDHDTRCALVGGVRKLLAEAATRKNIQARDDTEPRNP